MATATAAVALTRDCNRLWLTTCALTTGAATTTVAPKRVNGSRVAQYMGEARNSFSRFRRFSLPIQIELRENNSVTTRHYDFVDIIQGYQVEALHTSTFWLSLLLINQLDCGRNTSIFLHGKCFITSSSSCNVARNLINCICNIVPTTALQSLTTNSWRQSKRDSWLRRVIFDEPTIEASESPTISSISGHAASRLSEPLIAVMRSTRKSLTLTESRLWHWRLAHMNLTAIRSVVDRYTRNDSMFTVSIQATHK